MAEQSKRDRRDAAREARRIAQEEAARAAAKARVRSMGIGAVSVVLIGALVWLAVDNVRTESIDAAILIDREAAETVRTAAGCEVLARDTPEPVEFTHVEPATAAPANAMYPFEIRPATSGPHFSATLPIITGGASNQLEERGLVHNLEHGAVEIFYDPEQVDGDQIGRMEALSERLNEAGFAVSRGAAAIFVSPYVEPGISSGKAVAFRAWGQAWDCDTFSEDVAHHFIREFYGTAGIAPEGAFAPYRFDIIAYEDEAEQSTDAPTEPTGDLGTMAPSSEATDGASDPATEAPSDEPSDQPTDGSTSTNEPAPADTPTTEPTETPSES